MNYSPVIYEAYQAYSDLTNPIRSVAKATVPFLDIEWPGFPGRVAKKKMRATCEIIALAGLTHEPVPWGIDSVTVGGQTSTITEEIVLKTPFCSLLHLKKDSAAPQPRVLLAAPLSGHFATLLRGTVRTLLRDHDVYVTDWHNVRDTPLSDGKFGLDEYIDHLIRFLETIGEGTHLVAVCQPTVAAIAVAALMAEDDNPAQPASMTLMAGPIDCRINPTEVNDIAVSRPHAWFSQNVITKVPLRYEGAGRRVYPGFVQLSSFMRMNMNRHVSAFRDLYNYLVSGDLEKAETIKAFYDEYFAVLDLPADFYLETVQTIFQEYHLARGMFQYRGRTVDPAAIRRIPLFTVEGEKDDICSIGQTVAAHDICSGLPPYMKQHHMQPGVGHYGVFNGRRWEDEIYPRLRDFIHASESIGFSPVPEMLAA